GSVASTEVASLARLLVACGAALPWVVRTQGADGLESGAGRRLLLPIVALAITALLLALFVPHGASSLALLAGLALAAGGARLGAWRGRPWRAPVEVAPAHLLPLLAIAAALVLAAAAGGAAGGALAAAAAAALLPALTLDGFEADVAAPVAAPVPE